MYINLTRRERLWGAAYALIQLFVLPAVLSFLNMLLPTPLGEGPINFVFFGINFLAIWLICHRFLWKSLIYAGKNISKILLYGFCGFFLYYGANILIGSVLGILFPDFSNVNDASVMEIVQQYPAAMMIGTVILVPVVEETIYRGVIFGGILPRGRWLAYGVSCLLFAAIHVVGYLGSYDGLTLLLCLIQYLPAGLILAWAYERSGTIWCAILIHMSVNLIGFLLMR